MIDLSLKGKAIPERQVVLFSGGKKIFMDRKQSAKGSRNIIFLGLVSCFADISSEMVYPVIPLYLTSVLGATPVLVGVIEGIAESLASLLKVFSGYVSDKFQKKKDLAFAGYSTGLIYKIALLFATSWAGILLARVIDRIGKGIRTAPRDVMVAESADSANIGKAFGIHKMLDMAGSAIGILIAYFLVKYTGENSYRLIFAVSMLPVLVALGLFGIIQESSAPRKEKQREPFWQRVKELDGRLKLYLLVTFLFTLGNSSNSFLLLRAYDFGFSTSNAVLLYFVYNLTASALSLPCGKLSDKIGRQKLLVCGYLTFSLVYFGFAFCAGQWMMVGIFVLYGVFTAMTAGVERAFISEIAPPDLKGTMLGLHSTLAGIALLPASVIAGALWDNVGAQAPFVYGGVMSLVAATLLRFGLKER